MLEEKIKRVANWTRGISSHPWSVQIQVSNKCNLGCLFCCRNFEEIDDDKISDKRLLEIIGETKNLKVRRIALNGRAGEPLMRNRVVIKMMEKIKLYDIWGDLITNGTLITPVIAKKLVEIGWDNIVLSVDGPNAKIHNYLRGEDFVFEKVTGAIEGINAWKNKLNKQKPTIKFIMVLTNLTYNKIDEMVKFANDMQGTALEIRPMVIHDKSGNRLDHLKINKNSISKLANSVQKAKILARGLGIELILEHSLEAMINYIKYGYKRDITKKYEDEESVYLKKEINEKEIENIKCLFPFFEITIFPEGTASPCCIIWRQNESVKYPMVENVIDKSLKEIWYGNCFDYYRNKILKGELPSWCANCQL